MKSLAASAVLALSLLASVTAHASSASAAVSNLRIQLIDLDLSDGIVPTITFSSPSTSLYAGGELMSVASVDAPLGPLTWVSGNSAWSAQSFGGSLLSSLGWSATASVSSLGNLSNSSSLVYFLSSFTLSANTQMVVTGDFAPHILATPGDYAGAESSLLLSVNGTTVAADDDYDIITNAGWHFVEGGTQVQASFANQVGASVEGTMALTLQAAVDAHYQAPVPEPTTTALMLGGLTFIGARSRRKSKR